MRGLLALFLGLVTLSSATVSAQGYVVTYTVTEEWVEVPPAPETLDASADRAIAFRRARTPTALAAYGPFRVLDTKRAALVGVTGPATPSQFQAMLRDYPELKMLEMLEGPGTEDDRANLATGRMIREAGMATHVPADGSVRSGAVELFLAGTKRTMDEGAEFAVHSWLDDRGLQADDYAADSPEHAYYLRYYREMGMDEKQARAFYDMTNSVPHETALWLGAKDMRQWVGNASETGVVAKAANDNATPDAKAEESAAKADVVEPATKPESKPEPRISYLDLSVANF